MLAEMLHRRFPSVRVGVFLACADGCVILAAAMIMAQVCSAAARMLELTVNMQKVRRPMWSKFSSYSVTRFMTTPTQTHTATMLAPISANRHCIRLLRMAGSFMKTSPFPQKQSFCFFHCIMQSCRCPWGSFPGRTGKRPASGPKPAHTLNE